MAIVGRVGVRKSVAVPDVLPGVGLQFVAPCVDLELAVSIHKHVQIVTPGGGLFVTTEMVAAGGKDSEAHGPDRCPSCFFVTG